MLRYFVQFECFDMCEGLCVNKARNRFEGSVCAGVDNHIGPSELTRSSVRERDLKRPRADEASGAEDEFRAGLFVIFEIYLVPARDHAAFAFADHTHLNAEVSSVDAKLFASAKVCGHLRAVNALLTGHAGNVLA